MNKGSVKIQIEPLILKYARFCSGYSLSEASEKTKISEEKLTDFESKQSAVSVAQLEKLANAYKMPLAFFLLKDVPKDVVLPKDFRVIYSSEDTGFSAPVMLAIRHARYVQSVISELGEDDMSYELPHITLTSNIEDAATKLRGILGVTFEEQAKWSDPLTALKNWKEAIEKKGIFIMQQSLPDEDVSAFCLADASPYIVVLNSSEHANRRMFSLFHEMAHILLNSSGVCTPNNLSRNSYDYVKIEKFCNQFAASVLVPSSSFLKDERVQKLIKTPFEEWSLQDVRNVSLRFRVSQEVIYRRFVTLGLLDDKKYQDKRDELIKGFEEYKKRKKVEKIIIPPYRKIISKNGRAFSAFVLDRLHSNKITLAQAANYLDTNSRHISKVEANI